VRILLVEDEQTQARLLATALQEADARFEVSLASTLREALDAVAHGSFDAALLDINLPDSRSLQTVERFRAASSIPIVVFTGETGIGEETIRAGADEYLIKGTAPPAAVRRALIYAVERWHSRRAEQQRAAELAAEVERRTQVEEELRRSESYLRTIIQSEPECVKTVAADMTLVDMNPSGLEMLEVADVSEVRGRSILDFIHPDDRAAFSRLHVEVLRGGRGIVQYRVVGVAGTERWVESHLVLLPDDVQTAVLSVTRDITDRRNAEVSLERSRSLLEMASRIGRIGAWIVDLPGKNVTWSDEVRSIFEVPDGFVPTIDSVLAFTTREERRKAEEALERCVRKGAPFDIELPMMTARGRRILLRVIAEADRDAHGVTRAVRGAIQDITERRRFEQQLLQSQRVESIGKLAGGIAHDLNNLLMPILMGANLLKRATKPDQHQRAISMIEQSATRGGELVSRITSFSRGAEGRREPLRLGDVVAETQAIVEGSFPPTITLETSIPDDLWLIEGDPTQLHQVLLNLCVNARDAMPEGGTLTISAANALIDHHYSTLDTSLGGGPYVRLEVSDTGEGIPVEIRQRVFDPFFTTKQIGRGTGLGLSTVAAIVRAHGGYVGVQSDLGRGTTFEIYFPALPTASRDVAPARQAGAPHGHGELVLVVDDDVSVRGAMSEILTSAGYRVVEAEDGRKALALFESQRGELAAIITDLVMPNMGGAALVRALQEAGSDIPIVVTSGGSSEENAALRSIQVRHFLQKPYSADVLLRTLRDAVQPAGSHTASEARDSADA
jgi:two-component system cell cycle sensor histidine kinase/response regulator CckA